MNSLIEDQIAVCRAAIAATISDRLGMPFARPYMASAGDTGGKSYFSICSNPPAGPVGYPLETELLPLEAIMRDAEIVARSEESSEDRGMTAADHTLERINAFVHDQLINPALPLSPATPSVTSVRPVNRIYGEILKRAAFAGSVVASSERYREAEALLFEDGARSKAYETYLDYEERIQKEQNKLVDLGDDSEQRGKIEQRIERLKAEWIGLGRKNEIERAFRTLQEESASAGFENERQALLERYKAGEKVRIDADGQLSYAKAQLVPLSPLFNEESGTQWQQVGLKADDVRQSVDLDIRDLIGISGDQLERATEQMRHLTFEYLVCSIRRDWLDTSFFTERYWRLDSDDEPISDGKGGGRLPTLPMKIIFIRDAEAVFEGDIVADFGDEADTEASDQSMLRTMQVLPDREDDPEEEDPELIKAAKKAGLSSSLNLLNRETKRAVSRPARQVMTVSHDDDERDSQKKSGNRKRRTSQAKKTARTPRIKAVAAERSGGSNAPQKRRATADTIRPSAAIKQTARSRSSSSSREERTRGRRSRTRRSSDRDSNPRVRDHRSRSRSDRDSNPRRRDHRSSSRDERSRDRNNRERHTARARRGRSAERSRPAARRLIITGEIVASEEHAEILDGVSLNYFRSEGRKKQHRVSLKRSSNTRLTFEERTSWRGEDVPLFEFILKDEEGDELDRRIAEPEEDESTIELKWTVTEEPVLIELAGKHTPTLHGYGMEIVPPCPDPDESLEWH